MTEKTNLPAEKDSALVTIEPTPMQLIGELARDPNVDVAKMERLFDLAERYEQKESVKAFNAAMSAFQAECPKIFRDKEGAHNIKYAPLDTIMATIQPALSAHGLSVRFSTALPGNGQITATCTVSHILGHSEASEITIPVDDAMAANSSQKMGSANSYAKRYALANGLNLAFTEDDTDATDLATKITVDQEIVLADLLEELNLPDIRVKKFLKWAKAKSVEEIPAALFDDAKRYLEEIRDGAD